MNRAQAIYQITEVMREQCVPVSKAQASRMIDLVKPTAYRYIFAVTTSGGQEYEVSAVAFNQRDANTAAWCSLTHDQQNACAEFEWVDTVRAEE